MTEEFYLPEKGIQDEKKASVPQKGKSCDSCRLKVPTIQKCKGNCEGNICQSCTTSSGKCTLCVEVATTYDKYVPKIKTESFIILPE